MKDQRLILFIPVGITVNILGTLLNSVLKLPLFLDSIGTIMAAVILGPWLGALTGLLSNLIVGVFYNSVTIPFGLINAVIGLVAGIVSIKYGFETPLPPLIVSLILTVICPAMAAPIAVYLFGGVTGSNIDALYAILLKSGHQIFSSAFLVRIPTNLADKIISTSLVMLIIRALPRHWKGLAISDK